MEVSNATEKFSASIILIGQFNPAIFSPAWIAKIGLVTDEDAAAATIAVIHPEVAQFSVGPYSFDVRLGRFAVEVASEPLVQVVDAVQVIFDEHLSHSPVRELGINYSEHYRLDSPERRIALGRQLAPLAPWGQWGEEIGQLDGALTSGVIDLAMIRSYDPPGSGERRVQVQPSNEIQPKEVGVFMLVNDHRVLMDQPDAAGAALAIDIIGDVFDESMVQAREIVDGMFHYAGRLDL